jgi:hypothetical protein
MILTDSLEAYKSLTRMSYDGRIRDIPWRKQNISSMGFHYYMMPELAEIGLKIFNNKSKKLSKIWTYRDYPDLKKFDLFR